MSTHKTYDSDGYTDSESDDEQSEIDKLLMMRAEELAIAKSLGFGFRLLESTAEIQYSSSQKANVALEAIKNPMQFKTIRDKVKNIQRFSKRLRSRISTATNSAIAAANKTYEGYKVQDNGKGVRTITKIDQLEKELAELKSLMQMMAKNNLDKNNETVGVGGGNNLVYKTQETDNQQTVDPSPKSVAKDVSNSPPEVHPLAAILKVSKTKNLKKVSGSRSPGGTPLCAVYNRRGKQKHSRNASFNESMLSKALHRKFKNTHCTSSDEDDSDSNFSSSSESEEESDYSSSESDTDSESEEDADTTSCNSDAEDDMKVAAGENSSMVYNASKRSVRRVSYGVGQVQTIRGCAGDAASAISNVTDADLKTPARLNLLASIKSFKSSTKSGKSNDKHRASIARQPKNSPNAKSFNLLNDIKTFSRRKTLKPTMAEGKVTAAPGKRMNFLDEIKNFKKSDKKLKRPDARPTRHTSIQKAKGLSLADSILMKQQEMQKKRMAKAKERSNENDGVHANIPNSKTTMESGSLFGVKLRKLNRSTEQNRTDAIV